MNHRYRPVRAGRPRICIKCGCRRKYVGRTPWYQVPWNPVWTKACPDCPPKPFP